MMSTRPTISILHSNIEINHHQRPVYFSEYQRQANHVSEHNNDYKTEKQTISDSLDQNCCAESD